MGTVATETKNFEPAPPGTHTARCIEVVDLGLQKNFDPSKPPVHQVWLRWQLTDERQEDGEPFALGRRYRLSLNKKATLRQHLDAWRGRPFTSEELLGFDVKNVLGAPCLVTVQHDTNGDGNTIAKVGGVTNLPKGLQAAPATSPLIYLDADNPDPTVFQQLPEWLQTVINGRIQDIKTPDSVAALPGDDTDEDPNEGIPF